MIPKLTGNRAEGLVRLPVPEAAADAFRTLIESTDALAAMLQTLRLCPTADNAQRVCLLLLTMAREGNKLAYDLAQGIET